MMEAFLWLINGTDTVEMYEVLQRSELHGRNHGAMVLLGQFRRELRWVPMIFLFGFCPRTFFNVVLNKERVSAVSYADSNIDWRRNAALICGE